MSLSLIELREDLRGALGQDEDDLTDAAADRLLNRSWWAISSQVRFYEKDATHSFDTVIGTNNYSLPTDSETIQKVALLKSGETDWSPLTKINDWNAFTLTQNSTDTDQPTHYSRRADNFILWPTPDEVYSVAVKYLKTLSDILSSGAEVPQEWHEVILWGAVSRGFMQRGDWNRSNLAQNQQALYLASLDTEEAKDQEDRVYSGVKVYKRSYR